MNLKCKIITVFKKFYGNWVNFVFLAAAGVDTYTGFIKEMLPGKAGPMVLMLIAFINIYNVSKHKKEVKDATTSNSEST